MSPRAPILALSFTLALAAATSHAAGDLTRQEPTRLTITLGNAEGEHRFSPDSLTLETGKLYALRLQNVGAEAYYFASPGLAEAVFTRKVTIMGADGKPSAEVYGAVRRIEVKPGVTAEWWFVPVKTGRFEDVNSTRPHTEAGMRAVVEVK